jgi:hypothetical protein
MSYVQIVVLGNEEYWFETAMIAILHVAMKTAILTTSKHFEIFHIQWIKQNTSIIVLVFIFIILLYESTGNRMV